MYVLESQKFRNGKLCEARFFYYWHHLKNLFVSYVFHSVYIRGRMRSRLRLQRGVETPFD